MPAVIQRSLNESVSKLLRDMPGIVTFKGFVEVEKTACLEIADKDIEELDIFQGFPESVQDGSARFVCEEG
jgi:hypothetical protein